MKKISIILIICLLLTAITIPANAAESYGNSYSVQDVTIKFAADSIFSSEEQQHFVELLIYGDDEINPYGLSCFLFGHNYESEIITTVTHNVRTTAPRCLEERYDAQVCSKCGDKQLTLLTSFYINCH